MNQEFSSIRDTLFGDLPLSSWPSSEADADVHPWQLFVEARSQLEAGNTLAAVHALEKVIATPNLESRHYLQARHALGSLGTLPSAPIGRHVYGVVVEVHLDAGLDIVAAYSDHTARYLNHSGAAVIWDTQEEAKTELIDRLLGAGAIIVGAIGRWEGPRPAMPTAGRARINVLTPGGLYFGEGPLELLTSDPLGVQAMQAALQLLQALASMI